MFHQPRSLLRCLAIGLAVGAIAPAAASAGPIIDGQGVAAGGGPGVTAKQFESQNLAAPDQVDRTASTTSGNHGIYVPPTPAEAAPTQAVVPVPQWPTGPQPAATRHAPTSAAPASPSNDGGLDTGVWIAIVGGSLLGLGAAGLAGQRRVVRKRQVA
jgi:hypothetical protein